MSAIGVDTSEFAGVPDYSALANIDFAIVRTSSGVDHVDKLAATHVEGFREEARVQDVWGYHYQRSWRDGAAQADHALATIAAFHVPVCFLNIEPVMTGTRPEDAPTIAREVAHAFLRRWIERTGRRCHVYGPIAYLRELRLDGDLVGLLWGALTRKDKTPHPGPVPAVPPWSGAAIHQYQHNARVKTRPGSLPAVVDWNRSAWPIDELRGLLGVEASPAPLPFDVLGSVITATERAAGLAPGGHPERFVSTTEPLDT